LGSGANNTEQLGLNGEGTNDLFVTIDTNVKAVDMTFYSLLIEKSDGSLWVTGDNAYGQLGLGHTDNINTLTETTLP